MALICSFLELLLSFCFFFLSANSFFCTRCIALKCVDAANPHVPTELHTREPVWSTACTSSAGLPGAGD
eukprot:m.14879 g.14879  ORF g.14879 m.14879 type:complete len:69 (+) comp3399_c0_seq1:1528-1734(+)